MRNGIVNELIDTLEGIVLVCFLGELIVPNVFEFDRFQVSAVLKDHNLIIGLDDDL